MSLYYPYLRGKQYELLAIRELCESASLPGNVTPVIEPVRDPSSGPIQRTINELNRLNRAPIIIVNPAVGHMESETYASAIFELIKTTMGEYDSVLEEVPPAANAGILIDEDTPVELILEKMHLEIPRLSTISLFHSSPSNDGLRSSIDSGALSRIVMNFVDTTNQLRSYRRNVSNTAAFAEFNRSPKVQWRDYFKRMDRSTDYTSGRPYIFTDDNMYLNDDSFDGLSDFQTIGAGYAETGGLPFAVALHLTFQYPGKVGTDHPVHIVHFVSDSNEDRSDPGRKFGEAVSKLVAFCDEYSLSNSAIDVFRLHHERGSYPGLGSLKKISIQNHILVMSQAIS